MEKKSRSLAKTLTWRVIASGANSTLVFFFIGDLGIAVGFGAIDLVAKSVFYYGHERMWNRFNWGRDIDIRNKK